MSTPVEKIKERLDIAEVLGSYIKLEKAGQNYKAKCPFHGEKTASFFISPARQSFYCFGCQANGDIFTFVERFEGLDFRGALKLLAEKAGVELGQARPEEEEKRAILLRIMEKATLFFENNLKESLESKSYLEQRGLTSEVIAKWRIGCAKDEWRNLYDFLLEEGFSKEDMLAAGVAKKVEGEDKWYDTFRNRIMFPIFDASGRVIAFSGRSLSQDPKNPKYLNSPETDLFKKSEVLYGLNFAKAPIRSLDYSVLVEGQMDLVLSHKSGIENAVASSGTALTEMHLSRLKKISNRIIFAYDGDDAGIKAARRGLELSLGLGLEVKVASMPDGEDPASVAERDGESLKEILRQAKDGIIWTLEKSKKGLSGVALAKKVTTDVIPLLALIQNQMVQSQYVSLISKETGIPEKAIFSEVARLPSLAASGNSGQGNLEPAPISSSSLSPEEMVVGYILLKDDQELRKRFDEIAGETLFSEIAENGAISKDSLVFQVERILEAGNTDQIINGLFERLEKNILKRRFEELATILDREKDDGKRKELEKEMGDIGAKLSKLSI